MDGLSKNVEGSAQVKCGRCVPQVHTYRFQGHSPADPEHERGRKVPQPVLKFVNFWVTGEARWFTRNSGNLDFGFTGTYR